MRLIFDVVVAEVESKALIKERQKKDNHNLSEYGSITSPASKIFVCYCVAFFQQISEVDVNLQVSGVSDS